MGLDLRKYSVLRSISRISRRMYSYVLVCTSRPPMVITIALRKGELLAISIYIFKTLQVVR